MPAQQGESLLITLYADIHYSFKIAAPSQPQQERFAKASYVYLYYSAAERRAKLEIANHAGTPDQDAFYGYLDCVRQITYSSKQPSLCAIILDQPSIRTQSEWHLLTWDERNEKRWAHKLQTIDLYFWTDTDALSFVTKLNAIVPAERLNVGDLAQRAHPEHRDSMSQVVQQLERTAVTSPAYPRAGSTTSAQSLPGPPTPASTSSVMPYNPAAPAAPEPIAHREKTPPPPDGDTGNGLVNAVRHDQHGGSQYAQYTQQTASLQSTPQSSYFPGQAQRQPSFGPQATSPEPQPLRQQSFGPQATSPEPVQRQQSFGPQATTSFGPTAASTIQYASFPAGGYPQSVTSPGVYGQMPPTPSAPPAYSALQSPGLPPAPAQQASSQPQVAGFSSYTYTSTQQASTIPVTYNNAGGFTGNIHSQLYRPTEHEAAHAHHSKPKDPNKQSWEDKHKISEKVSKVEKGIGNFLKKLDNF